MIKLRTGPIYNLIQMSNQYTQVPNSLLHFDFWKICNKESAKQIPVSFNNFCRRSRFHSVKIRNDCEWRGRGAFQAPLRLLAH